MIHPENNESKTAGAAYNLAEGPEPDIPVETEDSSEWFYILILNLNIFSSVNYQLALNYTDVMTIRFIKVSYCWGGARMEKFAVGPLGR